MVFALIFAIAAFFILKKTFFNTGKKTVDTVKTFNKSSFDTKKSSQNSTDSIVTSIRKYYYRLSLVEYTDSFNIKRYYYNNYQDKQLLPIETIEEPLITTNNGGFVVKYVVCTFPDSRFIPAQEVQTSALDDDPESVSADKEGAAL